MAIQRKARFYNLEIKRVLVQLMACFSGMTVETGTQYDGTTRILDVPLIYGNMTKQAAFILSGGSNNAMSYVPCGALNMTTLERDDNQRRTPYYSEKFNYIERAVNADGVVIAGVPGKKKTVERFMPVPHQIGFEVSFWCSNEDQRFQLIEQIGALYSVQMDYLVSNSPSDWTNLNWILFSGKYGLGLTALEGTETKDPYYTITFPFTASMWMGLPVKVYESKFIEKIMVPIYQLSTEIDWDAMPELDELVIRADPKDVLRFDNMNPAPVPPLQD